jgi:aminoglycoside phosphotransferase (APT) family kinase protein
MAVEEGWRRRHPRVQLDLEAIRSLIGNAVLEAEVLAGGLRNTNYRLRLAREQPAVVLRLYTAEAAACAREVSLMRLVGDRVPVPRVLNAAPDADPPWVLMEWIDGLRFDQMLVQATPDEVEQACRSAGEVLAAIHGFVFAGPGFLGPNLEIREPMGYAWLTGVEEFFAGEPARQLVGARLANGVVRLVRQEAGRLASVWGQSSLVHADYKPWNLLVRHSASGWAVSAALDWEFTFAGPPLCDFGIFLRYSERMPPEYEAGFLDGYRGAGGSAPAGTRNLARLIDLVSLWTFLERGGDDPAIVRDIKPLLVATIDAFSTRRPLY